MPATQVHGEGIFIRFDADALKDWAEKDSVKALDARLQQGHSGWRHKRNLDPNQGYPGVRYVMLHTLAHMLIRELALECGYNAASIRERVYADVEDGRDQAGFLIYTAAADSDGTLGGLVELGKSENLGDFCAKHWNALTYVRRTLSVQNMTLAKISHYMAQRVTPAHLCRRRPVNGEIGTSIAPSSYQPLKIPTRLSSEPSDGSDIECCRRPRGSALSL